MILAIVAALAAGVGQSKPQPAPDTDFIELTQGWDDTVREQMHHLSFGSQMLPYDWLLHLERADGAGLLRDNDNLAALGFIPAQASELNPDGLPVGFSRTAGSDGKAWVGFTCSACHTGLVSYQGDTLIVDGAPALMDFSTFEQQLIDALALTLADAERFDQFADAVGASSPADLRVRVQQRLGHLRQRQSINHSDVPYGHGRLDAFGQIFNTVAAELLANPANARPADAPVSYPFLWDAPYLDLVQWNGSAPNLGPGPLIQNVTTALAVYGSADLSGHSALTGYPSSALITNLGILQKHYDQLRSPQWPVELLGLLDQAKVEQGRQLYQDNCLACHTIADRSQPPAALKVTVVPRTEIGTDPRMATNFIAAQAQTGMLDGRRRFVLAGPTFGAEARTIDMVIHAALGVTLHHPVEATGAALEDLHKVFSSTPNKVPDQYKARPLNGIWATAPYLHNGSVPTLYDLLLPPAERPQSFHVGSHQLDPDKVGFDITAGPETSLFDTRLPGNRNHGHIYGTDLTDAERWALIEYLKSL
ncbi:di-heme-cytochrome C peroxidase [Marinobacter zhejiangensis]|uniref:di-heme-cytochrome C peroxidase n=1 Tax=Marinobacter zhejiangensis TaxID=488535 RepID=UPI001C316FB8|nr:di-heme-cytochrome C peroxidase [Marinobacter zhejiangensis]